ncbi:hypothetical protein ACB098_05G152000 [Castanea mollissima]
MGPKLLLYGSLCMNRFNKIKNKTTNICNLKSQSKHVHNEKGKERKEKIIKNKRSRNKCCKLYSYYIWWLVGPAAIWSSIKLFEGRHEWRVSIFFRGRGDLNTNPCPGTSIKGVLHSHIYMKFRKHCRKAFNDIQNLP